MHRILGFLVSSCGFLWSGARYRIVDSRVGTSNGGDAWLLVASDVLRMRFTCDRGQLLLDLQGVGRETSPDEDTAWYSVDIVWHLLRGEPRDTGLLDAEYADFVRDELPAIETVFSDPQAWDENAKAMRGLMRQRAKRLFG